LKRKPKGILAFPSSGNDRDDFWGYRALACDILYLAVIDYQKAKKAEAELTMERLQNFFKSRMFEFWCDVAGINPEVIKKQVLGQTKGG
jgi:hypothetical protein